MTCRPGSCLRCGCRQQRSPVCPSPARSSTPPTPTTPGSGRWSAERSIPPIAPPAPGRRHLIRRRAVPGRSRGPAPAGRRTSMPSAEVLPCSPRPRSCGGACLETPGVNGSRSADRMDHWWWDLGMSWGQDGDVVCRGGQQGEADPLALTAAGRGTTMRNSDDGAYQVPDPSAAPAVGPGGAVAQFEAAADSSATGEDRHLLPDRLCRAVAEVLGVDGVAISVYLGADIAVPVGANTVDATLGEALQFTVREGPCFEAYSSRRPVLIPDIHDPQSPAWERWPTYTAQLIEHTSYHGVFAYPLL